MISRLLGKKPQPYTSPESVDLSAVDYSFRLLKLTALEVAQEASNAAVVLEQEQRRTKACFTALNSASDIIFIVNNEEKIFFVNDKFVERFGIQTYDHVVDRPMIEALPGIQNYAAMWDRIRRNKSWEDVYEDHYRLTIIPMMNGKSEPVFYICTIKPYFINNK